MDFIQTEILDESYKKDEASGGESSKQNDDVDKKIQLKITRLNENFLSNLKRKRKVSTDSLESLTDESNEKFITSKNISPSRKVEQYLSDTGLNAQLVARNDKKLVKINVNTNKDNNKFQNYSYSYMHSNDFDDLPSESDISNATIVIPITNTLSQAAKLLPLDRLTQNKSVSISFKCVKCNKIFTNEDSLRLHQANNCSNENLDENIVNFSNDDTTSSDNSKGISPKKQSRTFVCTECGMQYTSQTDLSKHMMQAHENTKQFECSLCDMKFYDVSSKNRHEKEHAGLKPFRCCICTFEFTRASNLRTHLLKVHSSEIGKLVHINKTSEKKLNFEFDMEAINTFKHEIKLQKITTGKASLNNSKSSSSNSLPNNISCQTTHANNTNNTIIYIKDPNNKNADIQHMVVYVDGKPIFVQNPKTTDSSNQSLNPTPLTSSTSLNSNENDNERIPEMKNNQTISSDLNLVNRKKSKASTSNTNSFKSSNYISNACKPVVKIPYLLAAAAAATSNQRKQQQSNTSSNTNGNKLMTSNSDCCARSSTYPIVQSNAHNNHLNSNTKTSNNSKNKVNTDLKQDLEYIQLVSMLKQKNEKLFNPLQHKT